MAERQQQADRRRSNGQPATNGQAPADDKPEGFQRFEGLVRKLVRVPKSELDAKRKAPSSPPR
jgi:hypothetical protein